MTIPCEECLVFPLCKDRYRRKTKFWMDETHGSAIFELAFDEQCNTLLVYLRYAPETEKNKTRDLYGMERD